MPKSAKEIPPEKGVRHFVFHACLVEQAGKTLTLVLPAHGLTFRGAAVDKKGHASWAKAQPLDARQIDIACNGRAQTRHDGSVYPRAARIEGVRVVFSGAVSYGRVMLGETCKLVVQANVTGIKGLPRGTSWSGFESIELTGEKLTPIDPRAPQASKKGVELADGGSGTGPHQPYP